MQFVTKLRKNKVRLFLWFNLVLIGFIFANIIVPYDLAVQLDTSYPCKIMLIKTNQNVKDVFPGQGIVFSSKDYGPLGDFLLERKIKLVKPVGAVSLDYIVCTEFGCSINGYGFIPIAEDLKPNASFFIGPVVPGAFAPVGINPRSYDLRYAGLIPYNLIEGEVIKCFM